VEKIEGAKLIGRTWHYYKRVPKRLVDAYVNGGAILGHGSGVIVVSRAA